MITVDNFSDHKSVVLELKMWCFILVKQPEKVKQINVISLDNVEIEVK